MYGLDSSSAAVCGLWTEDCELWTCLHCFHSQRGSVNDIAIFLWQQPTPKSSCFCAIILCVNCWVYAKGVKRVFIVNFAPTVGWCVRPEVDASRQNELAFSTECFKTNNVLLSFFIYLLQCGFHIQAITLVPCYSPASFPVFGNGRPFTDDLNFPFNISLHEGVLLPNTVSVSFIVFYCFQWNFPTL